MTRTRFRGPRVVAGGRLGEQTDTRVAAVLDVLAGERVGAVAERRDLDPALLHRWTQSFIDAGTAQVTHRPPPDLARQRDRFLSVFTHGLRSPLAVAQAWVGLLGDMSGDPGSRAQALTRLQSALDLLDERTAEVELLTAAMLGRVEPEPHPVTLGELAASLVLPEEIGGAGADTVLHVDPDLVTRVLRDLWRAATTTRPAPHQVVLEVQRVEPWTEVRVVRAGEPIEPGTARALFEPFDTPDGTHSGITVGLYLARALVVVHGGTLGMEQDDAQGVLWARFPDPPPLDAPHAPHAPQTDLSTDHPHHHDDPAPGGQDEEIR